MTDIVGRLRRQPEDANGPSRMGMLRERLEAADEIERLREEVEGLTEEMVAFKTVLYAEIPGLTIVRREDGTLAAITITDDDHQIQRILWE